MNYSDEELSEKNDFYVLYEGFSDFQIMEILRNHNDYQDAAIDAAVKVAIERQLIHSEQDLLAPEFQSKHSFGVTLFPKITNAYQWERMVGSIFRVLYLISLAPLIYGILSYAKGGLNQAYLGIGIGLTWFLLCLLLNKTKKTFILILHTVLLALVSALASKEVFGHETVVVPDLVMLIVSILLVAYFLVYLNKLLKYNHENS